MHIQNAYRPPSKRPYDEVIQKGNINVKIDQSLINFYNRKFRNRYNIQKINDCGIILLDKHDDPYVLFVEQVESQKWGLPKGHMETDKDKNKRFDCAKRELSEETGINLNDVQYRSCYNKLGSIIINNKLFYIIQIDMDYRKIKVNVDLNEIKGSRWVKVSEIIRGFYNHESCNRTLRELIKLIAAQHISDNAYASEPPSDTYSISPSAPPPTLRA